MSYQYGETIEVRSDQVLGPWSKRIYVGSSSKGVLCVTLGCEYLYQRGDAFETELWRQHRPFQQRALVPWTLGDVGPGMMVRRKCWMAKAVTLIIAVHRDGVTLYDGALELVSYDDLLAFWQTVDGTPCGKEQVVE